LTIYFENEQEHEIPFDYEALIKTVVEAAVKSEGCPYEVQASVVITDNENIRQTNKEFRGIDKATDVLSFPMHQYSEPAFYDELEDEDFDPESDELVLGDIMISFERATEQAVEFGHSVKREIAFLTAHSVLHLLGYDHMEDEERIIMEEKQEAILQGLGITRV